MAKNIILFNGQSGINTNESFVKLIKYCSHRGQKVAMRKFEDFFMREYLNSNPPDAAEVKTKGGYLLLLRKPKPELKELWKKAFRAFFEDISQIEEDVVVFVTMHAVFYHQKTREFFSCVDFESIQELPIKKVVMLIDDIYDVYSRLRENYQMYSDYLCYPKSSPLEVAVDSVLNLLNILDWRSIEIVVSEFIANTLKSKPQHYLLAVKHPLSITYDLLFSEKKPYYISHPISEVRKLWNRDKTEEARKIESEINTLIRGLQRSRKYLPFFPTTIDELRIQTNKAGKFIPQLGKRWEYEEPENLLFVGRKMDENPLDPRNYFSEERPETEVMSSLLTVLQDKVSKQISSRDYKLVEQCEGLFVYRPYFRGSESTGVESEVKFNFELSQKSSRRSFFLSRHKDIAALRIRKALGKPAVYDPPSEDLVLKFIEDGSLNDELLNGTLQTGHFRSIVEQKYGYNPTFDFSKIIGPFSGEKSGTSVEEINIAWEKSTKRANESVPMTQYLAKDDVWIVDEITPDMFLDKYEA